MYIYSSFTHSLTGQIFIEQLLYNQTSCFYYSKRDFRRLFAFLVSRSTLKSVSPLPSVFLVYVVKPVNISFTFYLLLSFDNLEAELKTSLLILATNNFWILFISRILDLLKKKNLLKSRFTSNIKSISFANNIRANKTATYVFILVINH